MRQKISLFANSGMLTMPPCQILNTPLVIDVVKFNKLVTSAYYDKQHVCTYLQPFFLH